MSGEENPLQSLLEKDETIRSKLDPEEIRELLDPTRYVGDAEERCEKFVKKIVRPVLSKYEDRLTRKVDVKF